MNWGVLIAVLIYEVVSIVGIGAFMAYKNKKSGGAESGSFAFAGGGLPASLVGITLALTLLGSAHNWGTCQNAASMGVIAAWFGIALCNYDGSHHTDYRSMDSQNRSENHR